MLRSEWTTSWVVVVIITALWLMLWGSIIAMLWLGARRQNGPRSPARTRQRRQQLVRAEEHTRLARQHTMLPSFMHGARPRSLGDDHQARSHAR